MSEIVKSVLGQTALSVTKGPQPLRSGTAVSEADREKLCRNFESYFINNMLQQMEKTTNISKKEYPEQTYMSIVYEKVADFLAEKGIGIKDMLMRYTDKENAKVISVGGDNTSKR